MDETTTMPKVKDCPFCHSDDIVVENVHGEYVWVCQNEDCIATGPYDEYEDRATEKWNTRPIEDELREEIEKLSGVINEIYDIANEGSDDPTVWDVYHRIVNFRETGS